MEKFKNALKNVNKFGVLALMFVAFTTLAFKASNEKLAMKKWGYNASALPGSQWVDITGLDQSDDHNTRDYRCDDSQINCSAEFDENQNPNVNPSSPQNVVLGTFSPE